MKKCMEGNLLKPLMMEVVGGFNTSLLLHRPPGDMLLFDLSQSLLGFCHEESKKKPKKQPKPNHPLSAADAFAFVLFFS